MMKTIYFAIFSVGMNYDIAKHTCIVHKNYIHNSQAAPAYYTDYTVLLNWLHVFIFKLTFKVLWKVCKIFLFNAHIG